MVPQTNLPTRSVVHLGGHELQGRQQSSSQQGAHTCPQTTAIAPHSPQAHLEPTPTPPPSPPRRWPRLPPGSPDQPSPAHHALRVSVPPPLAPLLPCPRLTLLFLFSPGLHLGTPKTASFCLPGPSRIGWKYHMEFPQGEQGGVPLPGSSCISWRAAAWPGSSVGIYPELPEKQNLPPRTCGFLQPVPPPPQSSLPLPQPTGQTGAAGRE